jgi:hypothetical protein
MTVGFQVSFFISSSLRFYDDAIDQLFDGWLADIDWLLGIRFSMDACTRLTQCRKDHGSETF